MLETWNAGSLMCVPTAVDKSAVPKGEILGVVAFLRAAAAQKEANAPLAAAATDVLLAAGRAVRPPVRGSMFAGRAAAPGGGGASSSTATADAPENDEDEEYARIEAAVTDMLYSPMAVTDLNQISEYIGETPSSLASSPPAMTPADGGASPNSNQIRRNRRLEVPASA